MPTYFHLENFSSFHFVRANVLMKPGRKRTAAHRRHAKRSLPDGASSARFPLSVSESDALPAVYLSKPLAQPLIYRKRIIRMQGSPRPGAWVAVYVLPDILLGYGVYNPRSEIAIRMLRYGDALPDDTYWEQTLVRAVDFRRQVLQLDQVTDAYRIVHAEGDGVSGLVVDRLGDVLSAEAFSLAMWQRAGEILARLAPLCETRHSILQPAPHVLSQEGFSAEPIVSPGAPRQVTIQEFGTRFRVRFAEGHKTGFFCDQRDNRRKLARFCRGKSVLDLCCYSGGFAIQAQRLGDAHDVTGVDLDEAPLALAKENAGLNQVHVRFVQADVFPFMRDMLRNGRQFDVVVLDPPKLIRSRAELEEGTRKHFDLNRLAMQLVRPGGILLSCTCAGLLDWESFLRLLYAAARQAGDPLPEERQPTDNQASGKRSPFQRRGPRPLQVFDKTGAASDHPIAGNCPETEYLRGLDAFRLSRTAVSRDNDRMRSLPVLGNQPIRSELLADLPRPESPLAQQPLPMSVEEARQRGWDEIDIVFVTGDAYIDHPSFAMAILGRVLEAAGFRVGIVSQPDWQSCDAWRRFGRPRLFFAISAGNMDSMINHYTANRKVRNDDAYSPGGRIGMRPDRATLAYCQRAREAYKGVPVIAGGVEASLRRLAHYDYWSDKVRRSILLDSKADLVVFGMGEDTIVQIARCLQAGETVKQLRDMRGVAYALGASETPPEDAVYLPSYEEVKRDKLAFAEATRSHPQRNQSTQCPAPRPVPRRPGGRGQSTSAANQPGSDGLCLFSRLYPPTSSQLP